MQWTLKDSLPLYGLVSMPYAWPRVFEVSTPREYAAVVVKGSLTGLVWSSVLFQDSHIDCTLICNKRLLNCIWVCGSSFQVV